MKSVIKPIKDKNYQRWLRFLLWSVVPWFFLCYLFAFGRTVALIKDYQRNKDLQQHAMQMRDSLRIFEDRRLAVSKWRSQYLLDSTVMDAGILASVNSHCDRMGLAFKEYKRLGMDGRRIWTRMLTVEGDFKAILQLVYLMEQRERLCRIAAVRYQKQKEEEGGALQCSIYIQNIINEK